MLIANITSLILLITIFGYALAFKSLFLKADSKLENFDFFYGLIFLLFLSLLINLFYPLYIFTLPIYFFGILFFIIGLKKKKININLFKYIFIIFIFTFIAFYNGNNIDSPMYHLQSIKWMNLNKIVFGLVNLEIRFGMNSSWHSILSLMDLTFKNFSLKFYFNSLILSVFVYEVINNKNFRIKSNIFIFLCSIYLLFFSLIHPFNNGIILNHLGNPERDIFAMISYFFVFYFLIKCYEKNFNNKNFINLLIISIFLCVTSRVSTMGILLIPILFFFFYKKFNIINFTNCFVVLVGIFWLLRNFILSGCIVFPIKNLCIDTSWSVNIDDMNYMVSEAMGITRDAPFKTRHLDFDYTINSFEWFVPWLKNYFFATSFIQIGLLLLFVSILLIIFSKKKSNPKDKKFYLMFLTPMLLNFIIWFKAPEVRYAWGNLIVFPCFIMLVAIFQNYKIINFLNKNLPQFKYSFYILMIIFVFKNFNYFNHTDILKISNKNFDYSRIVKIGNYDGYNIYKSENWQCADFKKICINKQKNEYKIKLKNKYLFILNN